MKNTRQKTRHQKEKIKPGIYRAPTKGKFTVTEPSVKALWKRSLSTTPGVALTTLITDRGLIKGRAPLSRMSQFSQPLPGTKSLHNRRVLSGGKPEWSRNSDTWEEGEGVPGKNTQVHMRACSGHTADQFGCSEAHRGQARKGRLERWTGV